MPEETESRLLWNWKNEKGNIEDFLKDPLEWVTKELQKACDSPFTNDPCKRQEWESVKTLTDIIRFINSNRKLLIPST